MFIDVLNKDKFLLVCPQLRLSTDPVASLHHLRWSGPLHSTASSPNFVDVLPVSRILAWWWAAPFHDPTTDPR